MQVRAGTALILPALWLLSGLRDTAASQMGQLLAMIQAVLFVALLLAAAWIDHWKHIIPDILNLGLSLIHISEPTRPY